MIEKFPSTFIVENLEQQIVENPLHTQIVIVKNDENVKENWDNRLEFLFSCIAMSVGLGKFANFHI